MNISGNTILITGGGSGIGRGLAEALHALANQIIIAGRRKSVLDETTAANPGIKSAALNIEDPEAIGAFAAQIEKGLSRPQCRHPQCRHHAPGRPQVTESGRCGSHHQHQPTRTAPQGRATSAAL